MSLQGMFAAFVVALALVAPAAAQTVTQAPSADVTATSTLDGVTIRYNLSAPVNRLVFADKDVVRETWTVVTPGLSLSDGGITSETPFDQVEIAVRPDTQERDRVYMGLSRAGDGWVVYGPALKFDGFIASLTTNAATALAPARSAIDGYAYLGPADRITASDDGEVIAGANVPLDLTTSLRDGFFSALRFFGARLGPDLPYDPTLIVSIDGPGPALARGDVTNTGVISVRFRGDAWRDGLDGMATFIRHEAFHLWNGHQVKARDEVTDPWLHEGGAEYGALVAAVSTGAVSEDDVRASLAGRLNRCRSALGVRDYNPARLRSGGAPYDCGVVVQWLADLEIRKSGAGDIFTMWRGLIDEARDADGYGVQEFRARMSPDSAALAFFDLPGSERWPAITARLAALGVTLENHPTDEDLMAAALFHVASRNCKGAYGFSGDPAGVKLDDGECGSLSGGPVIVAVEDFAPTSQGKAMFGAVQTRCAAKAAVRYRTQDGRVLEGVCDAPLAEPRKWAVASSPALALSAS